MFSEIIEKYKEVIIQIATPYTLGTGFYLKSENLIITNEHVVRGNKEVVIEGHSFEQKMAKVLFVDQEFDIAFIDFPKNINLPGVELDAEVKIESGNKVIAIGHPFGLKYAVTQGIVSKPKSLRNDLHFIQHDAALNPGNSGGPLLNEEGKIIGINSFGIKEGNSVGFSLPINHLVATLEQFNLADRVVSAKCFSCSTIVHGANISKNYCPNCGYKIKLPSQLEKYNASGLAKTIESLIEELNYNVAITRRGPSAWEINKGSAKIKIGYHEKSGLIMGDAYLCTLPQKDNAKLYQFLLKENYKLDGLTFSVKGQDVILSLLIYDKYFNMESGKTLFHHLFEKADYYDNILIEIFGAIWRLENH